MQVHINQTLLDKENCFRQARMIRIKMDEIKLAQEIYAHTWLYYQDKENCFRQARMIRNQMDEIELAQEIYAHAWMYYHIPIRWIRKHADPVDLQDGGDTRFRKLAYRLIWALT